jgi:hypothetical protein
MNFHIGIAPYTIDDDDFIVAALTYYQKNPDFSLYRLTLPVIRDCFCSVVFIRQHSLVSGVNTAVNRSLEKLLIKKLITPEKQPSMELLVKPALRGLEFVIPHQVLQKHWLLNSTQKALELWLQGEEAW